MNQILQCFAIIIAIVAPTASIYAVSGDIWDIYNLGTLGGSSSYGYAINASGQVVGESYPTGDTAPHAFLYTGSPGVDGHMADLGMLPGGTQSNSSAINDSGQVVGWTFFATMSRHTGLGAAQQRFGLIRPA